MKPPSPSSPSFAPSYFLFFSPPPFSLLNQNIRSAPLFYIAVKSADVSGWRPEVILPRDPTPVPGVCVPVFPL